jgi:hypothetical protein
MPTQSATYHFKKQGLVKGKEGKGREEKRPEI